MVNHGNLTRNYSIPIIIILIIIIIVIKKVMQLRNSPCFSCAACSLSDTWPFASNCLCYRTTNNGTCLAIGAIKLLTKKNQNNQMATPPGGEGASHWQAFGKRFPLNYIFLHLCGAQTRSRRQLRRSGGDALVLWPWRGTWHEFFIDGFFMKQSIQLPGYIHWWKPSYGWV
jgi:hypothetical protein